MKEFLSQNRVTFEEKSLEHSQWLEELAEQFEAYSAPSVVVDGELVEGGLPALAAALGLEF